LAGDPALSVHHSNHTGSCGSRAGFSNYSGTTKTIPNQNSATGSLWQLYPADIGDYCISVFFAMRVIRVLFEVGFLLYSTNNWCIVNKFFIPYILSPNTLGG